MLGLHIRQYYLICAIVKASKAAYLPKPLALEVSIQASDQDVLPINVSGSGAELQKVWQKLGLINGYDLKLMILLAQISAQLAQRGCCIAFLRSVHIYAQVFSSYVMPTKIAFSTFMPTYSSNWCQNLYL